MFLGNGISSGDKVKQDQKYLEAFQVEIKCVERLQAQFDSLTSLIKEKAQKHVSVCQVAVNKLESLLLTHEIRGKTIIAETISSGFCPFSCYFPDDLKRSDLFLNQKQRDSNQKSDTGESSTQTKTNQVKGKEAQAKTMENAYHLIPSIMKVCEEKEKLDDDIEKEKEEKSSEKPVTNCKSMKSNTNTKIKPEQSEAVVKVLTKNVHKNASIMGSSSKWSSLIQSLKNFTNCQKLLGGDIRVSSKEKRVAYVISTGGNFNPVEMGLDITNRPLAVKRVPKESSVCKTIKHLINPLLGLRNAHILHYFVCDYEANELILATPLCEYNIGQYLALVRQNSQNQHMSMAEVVGQFLAGLKFLHCSNEPIVHGNLKPSNIFVDLNGIVRIAEFGMHKVEKWYFLGVFEVFWIYMFQALFKLNEAPDSSIIWFSRETYEGFQHNSVVECTRSSDIQVAGRTLIIIKVCPDFRVNLQTGCLILS